MLAADPVIETRKIPKEVCEDVAVEEQAPVKDPNRIAGTAIGAVAGGLVGSQIGGAADASCRRSLVPQPAATRAIRCRRIYKKKYGKADRDTLPHGL